MYLGAAALAAGIIAMAVTSDYRQWAEIAIGPYLGAAAASWIAVRRRGDGTAAHGRVGDSARATIALSCWFSACCCRSAFSWWSGHTATPGANAQPEVAVIERAGDRAAQGTDPYLLNPRSAGASPSSDSHAVDNNAFFPYLPGMAVFGMTNVLTGSPELNDARVIITLFTLLVAILALSLVSAPPDRRWRAFQFLVVLPSGALPLVTGGDDLPVLALMFLAMVLAQRHRPVSSELVIGLAGTLEIHRVGAAHPARIRRVRPLGPPSDRALPRRRPRRRRPGDRSRGRHRAAHVHHQRHPVPARFVEGAVTGGEPVPGAGTGDAPPTFEETTYGASRRGGASGPSYGAGGGGVRTRRRKYAASRRSPSCLRLWLLPPPVSVISSTRPTCSSGLTSLTTRRRRRSNGARRWRLSLSWSPRPDRRSARACSWPSRSRRRAQD